MSPQTSKAEKARETLEAEWEIGKGQGIQREAELKAESRTGEKKEVRAEETGLARDSGSREEEGQLVRLEMTEREELGTMREKIDVFLTNEERGETRDTEKVTVFKENVKEI